MQPQYKVGSYRMDMVVAGNGKRPRRRVRRRTRSSPEQLQGTWAAQAILERLGWLGSSASRRCFLPRRSPRDENRFRRLEELGVTPGKLSLAEYTPLSADSTLRNSSAARRVTLKPKNGKEAAAKVPPGKTDQPRGAFEGKAGPCQDWVLNTRVHSAEE